MGVPELESGTSSLSATRSNQLSYTPGSDLRGLVNFSSAVWRLTANGGATHTGGGSRLARVYAMEIDCQRDRPFDLEAIFFGILSFDT